jgi:sugar phosphate isomerase/epimerase
MTPLRVGIDNYGLFPLELSPLDTLRWAVAHGAEGVAFSGLSPSDQEALDRASLQALAAFARDHGLYLEWGGAQHIPRDMTAWGRKDTGALNRRAARQAATLGARVVRSCSGGLMRWMPDAPPTETLLRETAEALCEQRSMLRDLGVVLAIETHFEFTSHELVRLLELCDAEPGDWLGICLDTMNLLTMIEDPVNGATRLLPWVVSTHIKDGGALLSADGLTTFPTAIGEGVVDLRRVVSLLGSLARQVHLSVEDHGGSFSVPIFDSLFLSRFPDLSGAELARVVQLAQFSGAITTCRPLSRDEWPHVCEARLERDVTALRALASSVADDEPRCPGSAAREADRPTEPR